jgi:hypothetical protein
VARWLGLLVGGEKVTAVDVEVPANDADPMTVVGDQTWAVQDGDRPAAFLVLAQRVRDYVREQRIDRVIVKGSALPQGPGKPKLALLHTAEVRGVVICAAAQGGAAVAMDTKGHISKTFGKRKVDDYLKDDTFWLDTFAGKLRAGSREAAMLLAARRGK